MLTYTVTVTNYENPNCNCFYRQKIKLPYYIISFLSYHIIPYYISYHIISYYKKVVATSISNQTKTSLRPKLRRFYDVFATSLRWLGKSIFLILFSLGIQRRLMQTKVYHKRFYSVWKETYHKPLKVAVAKKHFSSVHIIDPTCLVKCFLFHVITGKHFL